uniref:Small monomeric GTPase n=1 Tax=Denticeps clupeoides TaxID=299321 RepID=A0AAY3ZWW2_9TELE
MKHTHAQKRLIKKYIFLLLCTLRNNSCKMMRNLFKRPRNCRRVVVLGAPGVGKTSILRRFLRDGFDDRYQPTSEDFLRKLYRIRGETYQIDILDASGERSFPAKRRLSILTGDIFLLVFSVDDRGSFEEVVALRNEIFGAKAALLNGREPTRVPTVVCANKVDLPAEEWAVSPADVRGVFETSAKDGQNLDSAFEALARRGGLPPETGPSRHRRVSLRSYQALWPGEGRRRGGWRPLRGAVTRWRRRPSFGSDLRRVLGPRGAKRRNGPLEKCPVQ